MPKRHGKRRKTRVAKAETPSEKDLKDTPRSFVVRRGAVSNTVKDLIKDMREIMSPNCAKALKESRINRIEDYMGVAGPLGVSHVVVFSQTKMGTYMKLARLPQGPTLTFRLLSYTLSREIRASQKRQRINQMDYAVAPLQILNGFSTAAEAEKASPRDVVVEMLRGLFPAVDVPNFKQGECKRTVLFNYDAKDDLVHFRHYHVTQGVSGIERSVQKLMRTSRLPKLGKAADIADFVLGGAAASDSEAEMAMDAPSLKGGKVAVRLTETGPRMTLQLVKVEDGVCNGSVLYHRYLTKLPSQQSVNDAKAKQRRKLNERNELVEKATQEAKAAKRKREEKKAKALKEREGGDGGEAPPAKKASPGKKESFHPFGRKSASKGSKAGEATKGKGDKSKGSGKGKARDSGSKTLERFQARKKQRTK